MSYSKWSWLQGLPVLCCSASTAGCMLQHNSSLHRVLMKSMLLQGGRMSCYLESLNINDTIDVKGPLGHFVYYGNGKYRNHGREGKCTEMSMIAGGTGITPMYQVIQVCNRCRCNDFCNVHLWCARWTGRCITLTCIMMTCCVVVEHITAPGQAGTRAVPYLLLHVALQLHHANGQVYMHAVCT